MVDKKILKPCPFCGSVSICVLTKRVGCNSELKSCARITCDLCGSSHDWRREADAVRRWNLRIMEGPDAKRG